MSLSGSSTSALASSSGRSRTNDTSISPPSFPECVARVPVHSGGLGLRVCSLDVAFASATVRNRSQPFAWGPYGRAYGKFYRGGPFWRFQTCGCFVSRGRCGTSWHSDVFCNVSQVVLRGRRSTLDVPIVIFYGNLTPYGSTLWVRVKRHAIHHRGIVLCTEDW